jgi:hypothetical protein
VLAASAQLKLELSRLLTARAELQLEEAQEDPSCFRVAVQLHAKAVSTAKSAAADAQQAGGVLQHADGLQVAAALLTDRRFSMQGTDSSRQQTGHSKWQSGGRRESCGRPGSSASASTAAAALTPSPGGQAATLEAVDLLQVGGAARCAHLLICLQSSMEAATLETAAVEVSSLHTDVHRASTYEPHAATALVTVAKLLCRRNHTQQPLLPCVLVSASAGCLQCP